MSLWSEWHQCVRALRPACRRSRTFIWMTLALAALSCRPEHAGVTSFVRLLRIHPKAYRRFLHFFHSDGVDLDRLTALWVQLLLRLFRPVMAGDLLVCVVDGIKVAKEGRKMPAVRSLYQSATSNAKPPFIMGHSFEAASLLVRGQGGHVAAVPLLSRIHQGLVWSNRDQRTLLDRAAAMVLTLTRCWQKRVLLVADAYYGSRKMIDPLLAGGCHLLTRARSNAVAYYPAPRPRTRRRGRPRIYGKKVSLKALAGQASEFLTAVSPIEADGSVELRYRCIDLIWRPVGRMVRFVIVDHPVRGRIFLMTTDLELDPLDVILLYSHRFKIEVGFRQALHVLGSYAYRFWMKEMTPVRRGQKDQYLHRKSQEYRDCVRQKLKAYHLHVQLGCIAQGLLIHLSLHHGATVWERFRSWLRTMDPARPPSELVTAQALRDDLPDFLAILREDPNHEKFMSTYWPDEDAVQLYKMTG